MQPSDPEEDRWGLRQPVILAGINGKSTKIFSGVICPSRQGRHIYLSINEEFCGRMKLLILSPFLALAFQSILVLRKTGVTVASGVLLDQTISQK